MQLLHWHWEFVHHSHHRFLMQVTEHGPAGSAAWCQRPSGQATPPTGPSWRASASALVDGVAVHSRVATRDTCRCFMSLQGNCSILQVANGYFVMVVLCDEGQRAKWPKQMHDIETISLLTKRDRPRNCQPPATLSPSIVRLFQQFSGIYAVDQRIESCSTKWTSFGWPGPPSRSTWPPSYFGWWISGWWWIYEYIHHFKPPRRQVCNQLQFGAHLRSPKCSVGTRWIKIEPLEN